jgi:hypothetical protein
VHVNPRILARHLERIRCSGRIRSAIFHGRFGAVGESPEKDLIVVAPELPEAGTAPFPNPIATSSLDVLQHLLEQCRSEQVDLRVDPDDARLLIAHEGWRMKFRAHVADPSRADALRAIVAQSAQRVRQEDAKAWIAEQVAQAALSVSQMLLPELVRLEVGRDGSVFRVTNESSSATVYFPDLWADEEYVLHLNRKASVAVLRHVHGERRWTFQPTGPGGPVLARCGGFTYLIAACAEGAAVEELDQLIRRFERHDELSHGDAPGFDGDAPGFDGDAPGFDGDACAEGV